MWEESAGSDERIFGRPSAGVDVPLKDNVFLTLSVGKTNKKKEPNTRPYVEVCAYCEWVHRHRSRDGGLGVGPWKGGKTCNTHKRSSLDTEASMLAC